MDQTTLPQTDEPQETTTAKFEEINRKQIRIGALQEFAQDIFGKPLEELSKLSTGKYAGVWLAIEKFKTSRGKFYRLVWVSNKAAWLAAEDTTEFKKVFYEGGAIEAATKLAGELNVRFSEISR